MDACSSHSAVKDYPVGCVSSKFPSDSSSCKRLLDLNRVGFVGEQWLQAEFATQLQKAVLVRSVLK